MTTKEKFWMAINTYHEAAGEPLAGKIAVNHTVMNRAIARNQTVVAVILDDFQFSWHNEDKYPPIKDYKAFYMCMLAVEEAITERLQGKTLSGVDHFFNPKLADPYWAKTYVKIVSIGNHDFYRSV